MAGWQRILIGWAAALFLGWLAHGPLGRGEAFLAGLDAQARAVLRAAEMDAVDVSFAARPLRREARLSGAADEFQREGLGGFPGINDRLEGLPGVAAVRWTDGPSAPLAWPLLLETLLLATFAFALGLALGWRLFRPRRETYLE